MAGTLVVDTLHQSTGTLATNNGMDGIAKAWVNFSGVNGVIRVAFNVSSVVRVASDVYTINFTTAMAGNNYVVNATSSYGNTGAGGVSVFTNSSGYIAPTSTSFSLITFTYNGAGNLDPTHCCVSVFRTY